ncbi:translation factor SUA5 [Russula earlei]|uniref:Translation factor SUA5 n=1 Tax=Russula earlei TaxID=71964 RepID=A0ACC0TWK7_9AGAM|nr:translation factor SUA5 [Russula earlei]
MYNYTDDIEPCLTVLQQGGLILYPTDTVWGIGCDATNEAAVDKIYALKRRKATQSMIVLVADERDILQYTAQPDLATFDYLKTVTKPTTVIYEGAIGVADNLVATDGSIGIRICEEEFCRHLIRRFKKPLVSTSANISGHPTPPFFADIEKEIIEGVDYVVQYRRNDREPATPSAVIKWEKDGSLTILRS